MSVSRRHFLLGSAAMAMAVQLPCVPVSAGSFVGELSWQTFTYSGLQVVRIEPTFVKKILVAANIFFQSEDGTTGSMSTADPDVIKQMEVYQRSGATLALELRSQQPSISFVEEEESGVA